MPSLELSTGPLRQFGAPGESLTLITAGAPGPRGTWPDPIAPDLAPDLAELGAGYRGVQHLTLPQDASLGALLAAETAPDAHVLAVCPGRFLDSPTPEQLGARKLAVLPAGSTPVTADQVRYLIDCARRTDVDVQEELAAQFFDRVEQSARLLLVDDANGTEAEFDHTAGEVVWNLQAGRMEPGDQQILPAGKISATAAEITDFDPDARLRGLTGALTLHGWPIVHRHADPADAADQRRLFEDLSALVSHPVTLRLDGGVIQDVAAADRAAGRAADALTRLLADDPRYRVVWELGFGINTAMDVIPANCGPNEVYGASAGAVNLGIGTTPDTRFALAFLCPRSSLLEQDGTALLGARKAARRGRLRRTTAASCGCH